jgi:hypothetical protein
LFGQEEKNRPFINKNQTFLKMYQMYTILRSEDPFPNDHAIRTARNIFVVVVAC